MFIVVQDPLQSHSQTGSRYSLIWFYFLALFLNFIVTAVFLVIPFLPLQLLSAWTPNIAALLVVMFVLKEKGGVRRLLWGWTKWRVGFRWYVVALSPIWIMLAVVGTFILLWNPLPSLTLPLDLGVIVGGGLLVIITGATGEELGWRGFALPRLQTQYSAFTSSLFLGLLWGFWHIHQYLTGLITGDPATWVSFTRFLIYTIALSILMTWVFNHTDKSLFIATLFHWASNFALLPILSLSPPIPPLSYTLIPADLYFTARTVIFLLFATIVSIAYGKDLLKKTPQPNARAQN